MGLNRISRAKRDQTWREDIITTGISRVEGIAVDWIAGEYLLAPKVWYCRASDLSEKSGFLASASIHDIL